MISARCLPKAPGPVLQEGLEGPAVGRPSGQKVRAGISGWRKTGDRVAAPGQGQRQSSLWAERWDVRWNVGK